MAFYRMEVIKAEYMYRAILSEDHSQFPSLVRLAVVAAITEIIINWPRYATTRFFVNSICGNVNTS